MPQTVSNQKTIIIKKTPVKNNFLQISNEDWQAAARLMNKDFGTFKLFLYLAGNEVGYKLALSQVAVENAIGLKRSTYYDSLKKLEEYGYLVDLGKNKFEFYTSREHSGTMENSDTVDISGVVENSGTVENELNSGGVDNSGVVENEEKINLSTGPENSGGVENKNFAFIF